MRILVAIIFVLSCTVSSALAAPQLVVDSSELDWGQIYSGEHKECVFVLHNSGDEPLIIKQVRSSCGCTAAIMSNKTIPPAGQAQLRIRFNSKHFSGQVVKRVMVMSNDPQHAQQQFTLRATIITELATTPSYLSLGKIKRGAQVVRELTLENRSDIPLSLKAVRSTSPHMRLGVVPEALQPGEQKVVQLTVTAPDSGNAVLNGYILIDAVGHTRNQLRLPVVAKIAPTVQR